MLWIFRWKKTLTTSDTICGDVFHKISQEGDNNRSSSNSAFLNLIVDDFCHTIYHYLLQTFRKNAVFVLLKSNERCPNNLENFFFFFRSLRKLTFWVWVDEKNLKQNFGGLCLCFKVCKEKLVQRFFCLEELDVNAPRTWSFFSVCSSLETKNSFKNCIDFCKPFKFYHPSLWQNLFEG